MKILKGNDITNVVCLIVIQADEEHHDILKVMLGVVSALWMLNLKKQP